MVRHSLSLWSVKLYLRLSVLATLLAIVPLAAILCSTQKSELRLQGQPYGTRSHTAPNIQPMASCNDSVGNGDRGELNAEEATWLFGRSPTGEDVNALKGWSHIRKHPAEFSQLFLPVNDPRYTPSGTESTIPECKASKTRDFVLVKKLVDWERQHSNGLEANIESEGKSFSQLDAVIIELKVFSKNTVLPSKSKLKASLGSRLTQVEYEQLDAGKFVLGLSVLGERPRSGAVSAGILYFIELEKRDFDRWLHLRIPKEHMVAFSEADYTKSLLPLSQLDSQNILHVQLMAETFGSRRRFEDVDTFGFTARNFIQDGWSNNQGEVFKELAFSIKSFVLTWEDE